MDVPAATGLTLLAGVFLWLAVWATRPVPYERPDDTEAHLR